MKKKICLITPNHIATNPRLVKEAIALEKHGFAVHLVFTLSDESGTPIDYSILQAHSSWTYDVLVWGGSGVKSRVVRFRSGLVRKMALMSLRFLGSKRFIHYALNRHFSWQFEKAVAAKADLYIGHNLGALPVAKAAALKNGTPYGFDAEDFHRQEVSDDSTSSDFIIAKTLEENSLPGVSHFTAASPLIAESYRQLFPALMPAVVLNVFPSIALNERRVAKSITNPIKLFWFSQTVGSNRGLETVVQAMGLISEENIELHLLGNLAKGFGQQLEGIAAKAGVAGRLFFYPPVAESEIFSLAAKCDIGMASEVGIPYNRNICLTNKIFTYIQSGLAVLASDTLAQIRFLKQYPDSGRIYRRENAASLAENLRYYCTHRDVLEQCKQMNYNLGQEELNWEREQKKFLHELERISRRELSAV